MADPLIPTDPLQNPPLSRPPTVADGTVRPDGTVAAPSDYDRLRRAIATGAGVDPATPLPISGAEVVSQTILNQRNYATQFPGADMPSEIDLALSRYVPIPTAGVFTPQRLGQPNRDNPETGTFWEGLKSGFRQDTLLGSIFEHQERRAQIENALGPIKPREGYSSWHDPQLASPERRAEMWRYVGSQSEAETALRIAQVDERRWEEQSAAAQGTAYNAGRLVGGLTDPTLLLTSELGLAQKALAASRAAGNIPLWGKLARGVEIGAINMAQTLAIEGARNSMDPSYTAEGLSDMMLLAGGIGFAAGVLTRGSGGLLQHSMPATALRWDGHGSYQKLLRSAPEHPLILNPAGGYFGHAGDLVSAGAAATPYMAATHWQEALEGEALKSIFGLEKFGLTPVIRLLSGRSLIAREFASDSADLGGLKQNKNVWNAMTGQQKTAFPVESEVAVRWKARASETEEGIRADWLQSRNNAMSDQDAATMTPFLKEQLQSWLRKDGQLSFTDFLKRSARAVANGNKDIVEDIYTPFVEKAARRGDAYFKELSKHAQETGLFKQSWERQIKETRMELAATAKRGGEQRRIAQLEARLAKMEQLAEHGPQVNTGPNYYPRMYRHDEIAANEADWTEKLVRHFKRGGASEAEARAAAAAATTEITHSNFRPIHEDNGALIKQAADPGSVKFRTLEIPDEEIADYLEWDLIGAIRHQTATMAPAVEMMRRWGDPSLTALLKDIQGEYEGLIARELSGTKRVQLQNEMKQVLEDVQAVRDRLLNVAGASKDPHAWDERTIRMLKHFTAWTTLGLSAVSQLGDLFRPVITEGLDATHRYGFLTLMDASRAEIMRMAQRERMMAGDGMELATGAAALAFSNIGDTYHSRSRLERQANQLSGAYFMLNGLTMTTDMTKRWGGLIVQGNLNAEIMEIARTLRGELGYTPSGPGSITPTRWGGAVVGPDIAERAKGYNTAQLKDLIATAERQAARLDEADTGELRANIATWQGELERRATPKPDDVLPEPFRVRERESFVQWQQGNNLTDAEGNQVTLAFHGTNKAYAVMEGGRAGQRTGTGTQGPGDRLWFTTDTEQASSYAVADRGLFKGEQAPNVRPTYIRADNPLNITSSLIAEMESSPRYSANPTTTFQHVMNERIKNKALETVMDAAERRGHDAVYLDSIDNFGRPPGPDDRVTRSVVIFDKKNIKSFDERYDTSGPPAPPPKQLPAFDTFMTGNAVRDADGNPIVVYHGTSAVYDRHSNEMLGSNTKASSAYMGHFFAGNPQTASSSAYVGKMAEDQKDPRSFFEKIMGRKWTPEDDPYADSPNIRPSYLRMTSPHIVDDLSGEGAVTAHASTAHRYQQMGDEGLLADTTGQRWFEHDGKWYREEASRLESQGLPDMAGWSESRKRRFLLTHSFEPSGDSGELGKVHVRVPTAGAEGVETINLAPRPGMRNLTYPEVIEDAKALGHDGVIIRNTIDSGPGGGTSDTIYIVFDPETQIRNFDERWDVGKAEIDKRARVDGTAAGEQVIESQAREQVASPSRPPRPINAHMMERLHSLSVDANDILAIADQLETHGKPFNSIHMANSDAWADKDAQMLYRGMIGRALNRTVITPGIIDRPTWMTTSIGSLIGQFKAFGMASTIRTLGAGLQDNDRQFWTGAATLVGSGVVLNELRNQLFYDRSSFDQPFLGVLADGLDRSGVLGSLMDVNNAVETVTNNKVGLRPLVGAGKNMPVNPEKFASTFFGPAAGKTVAAGKTIGEIMSGNADARTWRDMRGFVPGQNIPYIDPIADRLFPKPPPRQRADRPQRSSRQQTPAALTLNTPVTTEAVP